MGTIVLCKQKGLISLITGCMFKTIGLLSDFMHIFQDFIHVHSPWVEADNPLGPKFSCQQESLITMVICCKFKKKYRQALTLDTSFHDLINVYSCRSGADNSRGQNI